MKLIQLSAFWKNRRPGGIGVTLTEDFGDLDDFLTIIQTNYKAMWADAESNNTLPQLISDLRGQLSSIGSRTRELTISDATIVIGNVWLLESHSQMVTDEFNGLQLAYVEQ